ncbi:hypothetical protein HNQ93_002498 [Hymenobacter luteus]|uniref:DNA cytosine methyltransferase n=2 Tax=Hymenobacter TaxID=89966 RepID=A0A7W9T250_9BACT|nr:MULTISPECIES: hypothetical protein [Hymenobacter]MBB4601933.1 hypothetical protein [Hymenobacter latericoloratus]MBB6059638.1 hypothetical protein [Hymenobacter luteus]
MSPTVISLFDHSGRFVEPWAAAGYTCYCVDVQHPPGQTWMGNVCLVGGDVRRFVPPAGPVAFVAAFPPCTDLSNAGAHLFKVKGLRALAASLDLVGAADDLCHQLGAPYFIENPRGQLRHYFGEPCYQFDPCEYAGWLPDPGVEAYTKRTCLWTGHGFRMPEKRPVFPVKGSMVDKVPQSKNRANLRSLTPRGFSAAVFHAHHYAL